MNDCQVTLTIPALTVHADDRAGRDRIRNALDGSLTLGAKVVGNVAADGDELTYTIRAEGSLDQLRPLTDWLAEHDYPSPVRAASPPPSDEEIRAFLERHPAAFRMFLDRAWRTDPGWLRGVLRRDARIRGGRREWRTDRPLRGTVKAERPRRWVNTVGPGPDRLKGVGIQWVTRS